MTGSIHDATPAATACCESTAPFGAPVEPEVYRINAGASLLGDGQSHSSAATSCTTTAGARSSMILVRSSSISRGSSGATVAPSLSAPSSATTNSARLPMTRSEEHTSELQSHSDLVCRLLLEKKK